MNDQRPTVVWDSWAGNIHPGYLEKFPHIQFESRTMPSLEGVARNSHGATVASCYASQFDHPKRIVFLRDMDAQGRGIINKWDTLDALKRIGPGRVIRSAGADDEDDPAREARLREYYNIDFLDAFVDWLNRADVDIFFAAGNSDRNDPDTDTAFPQRDLATMSERVIVVAACDVNSVPAYFSSDDVEHPETIAGMTIGVDRAGVDPFTGAWTANDGTSFSAPTLAGDAEAAGVHGLDVLPWIESQAIAPADFQVPHPKAGRGSMVRMSQGNMNLTKIHPAAGEELARGLYEFAAKAE